MARREVRTRSEVARRSALLGGGAACVASLILPLHVAGGSGLGVAVLFALAGVALALATVAWGAALAQGAAERPSMWALAGAMSFLVGGLGLLAAVAGWPMVASEVLAVLVMAAWWIAVAWTQQARAARQPHSRALGIVSGAAAALALAALALQLLGEHPAGVVPARLAYVAWGPWGLALASHLRAKRPAATTESVRS